MENEREVTGRECRTFKTGVEADAGMVGEREEGERERRRVRPVERPVARR